MKSFSSHVNSVKIVAESILSVLKSTEDITSINANVNVTENTESGSIICSLNNSTSHENKVFSSAISELLSPIDNPRYVLIKNNNYSDSFSCPSVIANKKENAEMLASLLNKKSKGFNVVYTRNENGRKIMLMCKKYSYMNTNKSRVNNIKIVN